MTSSTLTQDQAIACSALTALGYYSIPDPSGKQHMGGPEFFEISNEALEELQGETIQVNSNGQVSIYQQQH